MEWITPELLGSLGIAGTIGLIFVGNLIKNWFEGKKDAAVANAEASLYNNLAAENKRMSEMLMAMNEHMSILVSDNNTLKAKVGALELSIEKLSVFESKYQTSLTEIAHRDAAITQLQLKVAEQALLIEKMNRRSE